MSYIDKHILNSLAKEQRIMIEDLEKSVIKNPECVSDLVNFICKKMEKEGVVDFCSLSDETKMQAVMEYVAIGLISGVFKEEDFNQFI